MDDAMIFSRILSAFESGEIVSACAWCGQVLIDGGWVTAPRAVFDAVDTQQMLSHSICDACAAPYLAPAGPGQQDAQLRARAPRLAF